MSGTTAHDPERRRYPRVKVRIPVELKYAENAPMRTATEDVSLCGCYIETMFTIDVGTRLGITLSLTHGTLRCSAVVATKYPQVGNGIEFIDITPEDRLKLNAMLQAFT